MLQPCETLEKPYKALNTSPAVEKLTMRLGPYTQFHCSSARQRLSDSGKTDWQRARLDRLVQLLSAAVWHVLLDALDFHMPFSTLVVNIAPALVWFV